MATRRATAARKTPRASKRKAQESAAYNLGQEAAFDSNAGGSYAKAKAYVNKKGTRRAKELLSGTTKAATEFRRGLKNGATGYEAIRGHFNPKKKRKTQRLSPGSGTKHAKAISASWEYGCQAAWEVSADGSMAQAKRAVLRDGTHRMKTLLKSSSAKGVAFRDGLRSCVEGYKAIEGQFNPRRRKNTRGVYTEEAGTYYRGGRYKSGPYEVIIDRDIGRGEDKPGTWSFAVKIFDTSRGGRNVFDGDWVHGFGNKAKRAADAWIKSHPRKGTKRQRKAWTAKGLRKNTRGAAAEREAIRYGVPAGVVKRIKRRKPDAWQDAPASKSQMDKTSAGLHWDVTSAHNTAWRYEIRKLEGGYVVGFKARRKGSKNRYVTSGTHTHTRPEYYKTQNAAFQAMVRHIMGGQHLKWKNPGRRR